MQSTLRRLYVIDFRTYSVIPLLNILGSSVATDLPIWNIKLLASPREKAVIV